ncbi:MAG: 50S ribosomal protein L10 [Nanoarchaeota archaeon]|nr:50S ribosomal protein L10 [Nanoarchaeota archaeon]
MVSKKNVAMLQHTQTQIKDYPVVGILNMHNLPGKQLFQIRNSLHGTAVIRMVRKCVLERALKADPRKELDQLIKYIQGEPALLLSNEDPFKLARMIADAKSPAKAKEGDIAPHDIEVKAGPTPLAPGPAIGELQKVKLSVGVEGDKIAVKKDTVVAKQGDVITKQLASVLAKLNIEPMEIGLTLVAAAEKGMIYTSDVLFVSQQEYLDKIMAGGTAALNLSVVIGYVTKENIEVFISKASREAKALAIEAGILTSETVGPLLAKGDAQAQELKKHVKEPEKKEEVKDEKSDEKKPAEEAEEKS